MLAIGCGRGSGYLFEYFREVEPVGKTRIVGDAVYSIFSEYELFDGFGNSSLGNEFCRRYAYRFCEIPDEMALAFSRYLCQKTVVYIG
jgi:cysteine synthase